MNWINSWKKGNKKAKYEIAFRLGRITIFELDFCTCPCVDNECSRFRLMILNFGFEI